MSLAAVERAAADVIDGLAQCGVTLVFEAQERTGLLPRGLRPVFPGARIAGSAITIAASPTSNAENHFAIERAQAGDVIVIVPTSPSEIAYCGDLFAVSAKARGCRGLVVDACVRDVRELTEMAFPVWCRGVNPLGPSTREPGAINVAVTCGETIVQPGDVIVADDDGICLVRRGEAALVLDRAMDRGCKEDAARQKLAAGVPGADVFGLRPAEAVR